MSTHALSSPHSARRARRKHARPGELLEAALTLFVERGYAATRIEDVATRAGVAKGTVFLYFESKAALFKAVVHENAGRHLTDAMREVVAYTGSSTELLHEFCRRWWNQYGGTPAAGLTRLMVSEASNFPELARHYVDEVITPAHQLLGRILARGIERGEFRTVDIPNTVQLVIAPLLQAALWHHLPDELQPGTGRIDPLALIEQHIHMLLRDLQPDAAP